MLYEGEISLHFDPPSRHSHRTRSPLLWAVIRILSLPEMPYGAADIHVCIIQALVITNYKRTRSHEYHYKFHDRQKSTYLSL